MNLECHQIPNLDSVEAGAQLDLDLHCIAIHDSTQLRLRQAEKAGIELDFDLRTILIGAS